jgi:hypothetical protein
VRQQSFTKEDPDDDGAQTTKASMTKHNQRSKAKQTKTTQFACMETSEAMPFHKFSWRICLLHQRILF